MDELLSIIRNSLAAVSHPRFYKTERGFQGAFLTELGERLPNLQWEGAIVEQEYQKRMRDHGIKIRPDIIIHVPFEDGRFKSRREGNFVVFELKLNASPEEAFPDYDHLSMMCEILDYPMGIFINIDTNTAHLDLYKGPCKEKLRAFSVCIQEDQVKVQYEYPR